MGKFACLGFSVAEIVEKYSDMVLRLAVTQTRNQANADDVYQEVFLRLIKNTQEIKNEEHLKAWLIRVTINCSKDLNKSFWQKRVLPIDESIATDDEFFSEKGDVYNAVLSLPEKYRTVIHLYYMEGYSVKEIADITDQTETATKVQLKRGRDKLREMLERGGYDV